MLLVLGVLIEAVIIGDPDASHTLRLDRAVMDTPQQFPTGDTNALGSLRDCEYVSGHRLGEIGQKEKDATATLDQPSLC